MYCEILGPSSESSTLIVPRKCGRKFYCWRSAMMVEFISRELLIVTCYRAVSKCWLWSKCPALIFLCGVWLVIWYDPAWLIFLSNGVWTQTVYWGEYEFLNFTVYQVVSNKILDRIALFSAVLLCCKHFEIEPPNWILDHSQASWATEYIEPSSTYSIIILAGRGGKYMLFCASREALNKCNVL